MPILRPQMHHRRSRGCPHRPQMHHRRSRGCPHHRGLLLLLLLQQPLSSRSRRRQLLLRAAPRAIPSQQLLQLQPTSRALNCIPEWDGRVTGLPAMARPDTSVSFRVCGVAVSFPVPPYACQRTFMDAMMRALLSRQNALLESPTGTGKVRALGEFESSGCRRVVAHAPPLARRRCAYSAPP